MICEKCQVCLLQEEAGGGLLVKLDKSKAGVPQTAAAVAARWFAQDMFSDPSLAEEAPEKFHASAAAPDAAVPNAAGDSLCFVASTQNEGLNLC